MSRFVVPSYRSRLSGFHPKGMSASIMWLTKGCRRTILAGWCMWERLRSFVVLPVRRGCHSPWVRSGKVWEDCSSLWGRLTQAFSWSWSVFSFVNSSSWRRSISAMQFWSCCRMHVSVIDAEQGWESVRGVSCLRSDRVLTMDECERIDKKSWGIFYRGPMVGAKCSY